MHWLVSKRFVAFLWITFIQISLSQAREFYIDFNNGNDANSGTERSSPWKTLPGTRTRFGDGWRSQRWGSVFDNAHKVPPGTTFYLKSGSVLSAQTGGSILIDQTFYDNGTKTAPITIKRLLDWGDGQIVIDGARMKIPDWSGIIDVMNLKHVLIDGVISSGIFLKNSNWNGIHCMDRGENGLGLRNLEVGFTTHAPIFLFSTGAKQVEYLQGIHLENLNVHDGLGSLDDDSLIYGGFLEDFKISGCIATRTKIGSDAIHLGSSRNGWILNCETSFSGEQGIDLSRDGDYKMIDAAYNITVRDCVSHDNYMNNFDHNSGAHHIYWINCFSWRTTSGELGDSGFNVHQGSAGPNWWINCSSSKSSDRGYNFSWEGNPWHIPPGKYSQYLINCISSDDSTCGKVSRGGSVWIFPDDPSGAASEFHFIRSDLNTVSPFHGIVQDKERVFNQSEILSKVSGWPGMGCVVKSPKWVKNENQWGPDNLKLSSDSSLRNAGAAVLKTESAGENERTLRVTPIVEDIDVSRIFRPGDWIQVDGQSHVHEIQRIVDAYTIELVDPASWNENEPVWFRGKVPQSIGAE